MPRRTNGPRTTPLRLDTGSWWAVLAAIVLGAVSAILLVGASSDLISADVIRSADAVQSDRHQLEVILNKAAAGRPVSAADSEFLTTMVAAPRIAAAQQQQLAAVLFGGALFAMLGALLMARAHQNDAWLIGDHVGKLATIAAALFTLVGIFMGLGEAASTRVLLYTVGVCVAMMVLTVVIGKDKTVSARWKAWRTN
ncbi:hypothetical protein BFL35_03125 [Clavibacter michiganensis]|nr:hypothetical protein BFL35_03125 [Clavibacter michiganensis]